MISNNLALIRSEIESALSISGRSSSDVFLIGVTKTKPLEMIKEAFQSNLEDFGENYVEEFIKKQKTFHPPNLNYHFIGRLPTKKVRKIVGKSVLIHTVDSIKLAKKIDLVSSEEKVCQDILVQVNQAGELSKSGVKLESVSNLVAEIQFLSNIKLKGFMSIPPFNEPAKPYFSKLRILRDELQSKFSIELPFLSMGMSGDFSEAIDEGATHIRIGTSIFGSR